MNIRFYGGRVLKMTEDMELTSDEVWIEGNRISYVGPSKETEIKWDREINLDGNVLMPGFKNAHTHSPMTFLRSYADDLPLLDWLNRQVFPMEAKLNGEYVYTLSKLAILEYLTSGITANFDMYMFPDENVAASVDSGFRTVLCGNVNNFCSSTDQIRKDYMRFNSGNSLISYIPGFHAEYTCSKELLQEMAKISHDFHAPIYTHNSECRSEVDGCIERYGTTPTTFLDSLGMFEFGGGGFHCVHMTDEDIDIFAEKGLWAVSNPGSNTKLASGIARLTDMQKAGVNLALGTDGPASNNCLDMFREMFLATGLQKLSRDDASAMDAASVLRMATVGGAKAMHLDDCDIIAEGKKADLIVINLHRPNMQPENNIVKNLVYSGSKENIKLTMVDGKVLYENGEFHIGENAEDIYRKSNEIMKKLRS